MTEDAPLTERQQQLMAYVDDELDHVERAAFEKALEADSELALEAVRFRNLMDLSRSMTLTEPSDHEMRRFWSRFYNRTEWQIGWVLVIAGLLVLTAEGLYLLITSGWGWQIKAAILSIAGGGLLLLWNTLRLKLRTSHYDRYRGVMR